LLLRQAVNILTTQFLHVIPVIPVFNEFITNNNFKE